MDSWNARVMMLKEVVCFLMTAGAWTALIAAVGVGTIVAAIFSRWSAISVLRQNWINALREDLVTYLKEIDAVYYALGKTFGSSGDRATTEDLDEYQNARLNALLVYRRILLRLNMTEDQHIELAQSLKDFLSPKEKTLDPKKIDEVITLSRQVLKHEWEVTKYGVFTIPASWLKRLRSRQASRS